MKFEDIFFTPDEVAVDVPQEWLSKVQVGYTTPTVYQPYSANRTFNSSGGANTTINRNVRSVGDADGFDDLGNDTLQTWMDRHGFRNNNGVLDNRPNNRGLARLEATKGIQKAQGLTVEKDGGSSKNSNATRNGQGVIDTSDALIAGGDFNFEEANEMYDLLMGRGSHDCPDTSETEDDLVEEIIGIMQGLSEDSLVQVINEAVECFEGDNGILGQNGIYVVGSTPTAVKAIKDIVDCYIVPDNKVYQNLIDHIQDNIE